MMRYILNILASMAIVGLAIAGSITSEQTTLPYSALAAIDDTALAIPIDFNGDAVADGAGSAIIYNEGPDGIYCVLAPSVATATGAAVPAGGTLQIERSRSFSFTGISCICAGGETATIRIWADRTP